MARSVDEHVQKALALWAAMSPNDQHGVRFGLFPDASLEQAKREGFNVRQLSVALVRLAGVCQAGALLAGRFELGRLVATPGVLSLFERHETSGREFLARHARGDWGDLDADDRRSNDLALVNGARLLSAYHLGEEKFWIITEADRSSTCFLLPSEY